MDTLVHPWLTSGSESQRFTPASSIQPHLVLIFEVKLTCVRNSEKGFDEKCHRFP